MSQTEQTARIPDRYIQKLGYTFAAADEAVAAANEAKRVADEKAGEARRALNAKAFSMELVYELLEAPKEASVDFQAGVLRWATDAATTAPATPAPESTAGVAA